MGVWYFSALVPSFTSVSAFFSRLTEPSWREKQTKTKKKKRLVDWVRAVWCWSAAWRAMWENFLQTYFVRYFWHEHCAPRIFKKPISFVNLFLRYLGVFLLPNFECCSRNVRVVTDLLLAEGCGKEEEEKKIGRQGNSNNSNECTTSTLTTATATIATTTMTTVAGT